MKKAIVTGANGFVGAALCKCLITHGVKVIAVVRSKSSDISAIAELDIMIIYCDTASIKRLPFFMADRDIYYFYHIAWDGVSGEKRGNIDLQISNIAASVNAVKVAKELGCKRFIGIGTTAEKDVISYCDEDGSIPNRFSHYGTAKITSRFFTKAECNNIGLEHIWATLSNLYGEGDYSNNFVNFALDVFLNGKPADFTNGMQFYDFTHINDAVEGIYLCGERGLNNYNYYIGSGNPRRLREYITCIRDAVCPEAFINFGAVPYRGTEKSLEEYSIKKAVDTMGYKPSLSFEEGIRKLIKKYGKA